MRKVELYLTHDRKLADTLFLLVVRALEKGVLARTGNVNEYVDGPFIIVYYHDNLRGCYALTTFTNGGVVTKQYDAGELFEARLWDMEGCTYYELGEPGTDGILEKLGIREAIYIDE